MTDGLDQVNNTLEGSKNKGMSRRGFLTTAGAGITAALAGCSTGTGTEDDNTTNLQTAEPTTEKETTTEKPSGKTFEEIYKETFGQDQKLLWPDKLEKIKEQETFAEQMEKMKVVMHDRVGYSNTLETKHDNGWKSMVTHEKALIHNQLGYEIDEARSELRMNGGNGYYTVHWNKNDDGDWIKHLGWIGTIADNGDKETTILTHGEQEINNGVEEYLAGHWNQEDITVGASTAIHTYREGVDKGETFEEYVLENDNPEKWMSAVRALDGQNDAIVVAPDWKERDEFGEIGYGREASNKLVDIQDFDANQAFNEERELIDNMTEFYHNNVKTEEDVIREEDTYMHLGFKQGGLEDEEQPMVELSDGTLFAKTVDWEQHKADAYNVAIPDRFWPEHQYPGDIEPKEWEDW